jgi:hypothetical protein
MPSPFPGMNPFLEQNDTWEDFHHEFLTRARAQLEAQVGPSYYVKVEVRLYIHELSTDERRYFGRADSAVTASMERNRMERDSAAAVAEIEAPLTLTMPEMELARDSWLEVRDRRDRRVVTAIELLSPGNKDRAEHREAYLAKRNEILASQTHLVEIDLLRGGERPSVPMLPTCDYYALVSRCEHRPFMRFWPISIRQRLPVVAVPLAGADPNARLDLQLALDEAYDAARYDKYIYDEEPMPPLSDSDAEWARRFTP